MSWDILVMNSNKPVDFEKGDWDNFKSREFVVNNIKQTFPDSNWQDPSWGLLDNSKAVIEFNIGDKKEMDNTFMLHVRGGQDPTAEIAKMCKQHNWIAYDISGEQFIDDNQPANDSFKDWENYRDQVVSGSTKKKAWWKFW
ncbi:hypothetical protein BH10BAC2_BH10BAC2_37280 [soil metagenome]